MSLLRGMTPDERKQLALAIGTHIFKRMLVAFAVGFITGAGVVAFALRAWWL